MTIQQESPIILIGGMGSLARTSSGWWKQWEIPISSMRRSARSKMKLPATIQPEWVDGELNSLIAGHFEGCRTVIHLTSSGVSL